MGKKSGFFLQQLVRNNCMFFIYLFFLDTEAIEWLRTEFSLWNCRYCWDAAGMLV